MNDLIMVLGFALAAYAIVANDSIQTLGTFLASNARRAWWGQWLWISGILVVTIVWGWSANNGDPAFGRLDQKGIGFPAAYSWLYLVPPTVLVGLTRGGIPVSTSLLVLTAFASLNQLNSESFDGSYTGAIAIFSSMIRKSLVGYLIALFVGVVAYWAIVGQLEKRFLADKVGRDHPRFLWCAFQWISTGFLWSMWLVQDLANVFVYLPRRIGPWELAVALTGMVVLQAILIRNRGGSIQRVVTEKSNTMDVRSATFIDFFYGLILLFFKFDYIPRCLVYLNFRVPWPEKMPMSTTWVFIGLLAGRELGMWLRHRHATTSFIRAAVTRDLVKVSFGAAVSMAVAFGLPFVAVMVSNAIP